MGQGSPTPLEQLGAAPHVLAFHGFAGTPQEVKLVVEAAEACGLSAYAPLLPGHGTHAKDLAKTRMPDWLNAAYTAFERTPKDVPVIAVGLSLGSLLAVRLAAEHPDRVVGLVLLANAGWLKAPFPRWALELARAFRLPDFFVPKLASDIRDTDARKRQLTYSAQPSRAAVEVLSAGEQMRSLLPRVHCKTLILHGARDRVCPVSNAWRVSVRLGAAHKKTLVLPQSGHILTCDKDKHMALEALCHFFDELRDAQPAQETSSGTR